ncbi:MAG: hypothetical protein COW29_10030 [Rhodobacterales bacterium CG15_BIG_FIL_POST_REV_8_21_14_020_59_13]|nr:MAG: hypothetical protein COW29_10030 [Rhodobacterales bacterium CG15_BIG_FIL_POST_REV_8_21_14_020_59_13]
MFPLRTARAFVIPAGAAGRAHMKPAQGWGLAAFRVYLPLTDALPPLVPANENSGCNRLRKPLAFMTSGRYPPRSVLMRAAPGAVFGQIIRKKAHGQGEV